MKEPNSNEPSPVEPAAPLPEPVQKPEIDRKSQSSTDQDANDPFYNGRKVFKEMKAKLLATQYQLLALVAFFEVFAAHYLSSWRRKRSKLTGPNQVRFLNTFKSFCAELFEAIPAKEITDVDVEAACETLFDSDVPGTNKKYANDSYNCYIGALGRLLEYLSKPPWKLISPERLRDIKAVIADYWADSVPRQHKLPPHEQERLMTEYAEKQCGHTPFRLQSLIIFLLLLFFGIREGMVGLINREDVDPARGEITLTFNKKRAGRKVRVTLKMPPLLERVVREFLSLSSGAPDAPLVEVRDITGLIQSAARAAGLDEFSPHTFRKLFITRALEAGVDIPTVAFLVGHEDGGRSIEKHYHQLCPNHANKSVQKTNAHHNVDTQSPEGLKDQIYCAEQDVHIIASAPAELAKRCFTFLRRMGELLDLHDYEKVQAMTELPVEGLPSRPTAAMPSVPKSVSLQGARLIAANLRNLLWKEGVGNNEIAALLELPTTSIYDLLSFQRHSPETLRRLAEHFQVPAKYFQDATVKRYDVELVFANVVYLAQRYGVSRLPSPGALGKVVQGRHLPAGNVLKALAEFLKIPLEEFLTGDVSKRTDLPEKPKALAAEDPAKAIAETQAAKLNLAGNIEVQLLRKGLMRPAAAIQMQIRSNQFDNYASGRHLPPPEKLQRIALYFGLTPEALCAPPFPLDTVAIGMRISNRLMPMQKPMWTAAQEIHIAPGKLERILAGKERPNGPQLHVIANYLATTPDYLLGMEPAAGGVELSQAAVWAPEDPAKARAKAETAKRHLAGNIAVQLLRKGLMRHEAARQMQIRRNRMDFYATAKTLPPPEMLQRIALFFGVTSEALCAPPVQLDNVAIGLRMSSLLQPKQRLVWKAAREIHIAVVKLEQILAGTELPNGPQLHLIANYLGTTPDYLLGVGPAGGEVELSQAA